MKSKTYRVSNMSCHACKATVEQKLLNSKLIHSAEVDLDLQSVTIQSDIELNNQELQSILGNESHYRFQ